MNSQILFFLCFKSFIGDHITGTIKSLQPHFIDGGKKSESSLKTPAAFGGGSTKLRLSGDST